MNSCRSLLTALATCLMIETGFAALGQTLEELTNRYGSPKETSLDPLDQEAGGEVEYTFYTGSTRISTVFAGGKCVNAMYFVDRDGGKFTEEELQQFFAQNADGKKWKETETTGIPTHVTTDESRCAVVQNGEVGFFDMHFWKALKEALKKATRSER